MAIYSTVSMFVLVVLALLVSPASAEVDTTVVVDSSITIDSLVQDSIDQAGVLDSLKTLAKAQKAEADSIATLAQKVRDAETAKADRLRIQKERQDAEIARLKASTQAYQTPVIESGAEIDLKVNLSEAGRRTGKVAKDLGSKAKSWATSDETKKNADAVADATGRGIVTTAKFLGKWGKTAFIAGKEAATKK